MFVALRILIAISDSDLWEEMGQSSLVSQAASNLSHFERST